VALDGSVVLKGVTAASGAASGRVLRIESSAREIEEKGAGPAAERRALDAAMRKLRVHLDANAQSTKGQQKEVLSAHLALLDDECLREETLALIEQDKSAAFAWRAATRAQMSALQALDDPLLAERADDLLDIERQIVAFLGGDSPDGGEEKAAGAIIVARELYPSQFIRFAEAGAAGICLTGGGPTSHVSILAGEKGIPALVAVEAEALTIPDGAEIILDADQSRVHVAPDARAIAAFESRLKKKKAVMAGALSRAGDTAITRDGVRIDVFANLGGEKGAAEAVALGAEGCGLLRTEFLYLGRSKAPSEDEQHAAYQAVADGLDGRPLVIRALDIGGDKPAPFVDIDPEENPALGLRGVRLLLARRDLLEDQLRAILRVKTRGEIHIMLPMVVSLGEIAAVREMLDTAAKGLGVEKRPSLGVMIETPASAIAADTLARGADFFSIGTNDLAQYVLAMDRGNPALAAKVDSLHPAVLRMIKAAAEAGARRGKWVGVCGSLASDPIAAPILIGLGVTELSAVPRRTPIIKAAVRTLTLGECRSVADEALDLASADEVRQYVLSQWPHIEDLL
ncbi:MAG: phosphoenolpyruvate--protein phosphotransferase, partial [Amphiplicatus sp.]